MKTKLSPNFIAFEIPRDGLSIDVVKIENITVEKSSTDFEDYEQNIFNEIRRTRTLDDIREDTIFRSYRDLYWTFGMDPTKLRVSSEALVRRVLNGHNLWRINNIVDVANLASAYHALPIGLIDEDSLNGTLMVRNARRGETFKRISGKEIVCRGREIVIADDDKIVCFGFATYDSDYTKVTDDTTDVILLIYGAPVVAQNIIKSAMNITIEMIKKWVKSEVGQPRLYMV